MAKLATAAETRMGDRTEGYHEGIDYCHGYYGDLNPLRLRLAFLNAGLVPPVITTACELGFGQGDSINLHAASSLTQWYGTDFNSAHASYAQELAAASGAALKIFDQSFAEFCARPDLPDFDFIAMHGVWSWISGQNRELIVDFIRRKLKAGGVVYVSYNVSPAHAAFIPLRDVLMGHANTAGGRSPEGRIDAALDFADKLLAATPWYAQSNPEAAKRLATLRNSDHAYVAHEYFNRDWFPTSFAHTREWLATAKLDYACSANYFDTVDEWNVKPEQQRLLKEISDDDFRETVRDFMLNKWFRRDYWVKGLRRLTLPEKIEALRGERMILTRPAHKAEVKATGVLGSIVPNKSIADAVLSALGDYRPKSVRQIEKEASGKGVNLFNLVQMLMTLLETNSASLAQDDQTIRAARTQTDKLNAYLCDRAPYRADAGSVLASPVIGAGLVDVGRVVQFFWQAFNQGKKQPNQLAAHAAQLFRSDIFVAEDEKRFVPAGGNLDALTAEAEYFTETLLPLLKGLHVL
jgi:hypothetical protein